MRAVNRNNMLKFFNRSEFSRNVLLLFSGSVLSQLIPFITLPILQKFFFSPADFGVLAIFTSSAEMVSGIACLKLEYGIVIQRKLKDAINLFYGAFRILIFISLVSFIVVIAFGSSLATLIGEPKMKSLILLIPIYIFLVGLNDLLNYWFNRKKQFGTISLAKINQTASAELIKLGSGFLSFDFIGLILGRISGFFFSNIYLLRKFYQSDFKALRLLNKSKRDELVKENRSFIYFTTPTVFISSLINLTYLQIFMVFFGKEIVGMLGVSMSYLSAGFGVIAVSFSQVFYSRLSEISSRELMYKTYRKNAALLFLIALFPVVFVYVIPVNLVTQLLGDSWAELLPIARIMVVWLSVWFVSSSLSFIYIRLEKQKWMLFFDFIHWILILAGTYSAYYFGKTLTATLWGFTIAQVTYYVLVIFLALYFIKKSTKLTD